MSEQKEKEASRDEMMKRLGGYKAFEAKMMEDHNCKLAGAK